MKQSKLYKLAVNVLGERLSQLGFQFEKGDFYRELPSAVIDLIMIGLDVRTNETFQVLCGITSRLITPSQDIATMGVAVGQHLTRSGWSPNSGRWPCADEPAAIRSLSEIAGRIESVIEPWFQERPSLSKMADEMDTNEHGLRKAKLYKADNDIEAARNVLLVYRERLNNPRRWDDPRWLSAEKEAVDGFLRVLTEIRGAK